MADELTALEDWAAGLLFALSPAGRRRAAQAVAIGLRRSQQIRIAQQRNPDGSPFEPRKKRNLRGKRGRIKRDQMFAKLRMAKYLKARGTAEGAVVEFTGRAARIARVHQYGLTDQVAPRGPRVRYAKRELLGFSEVDRELVHQTLIAQLDRLTS